MICYMGIVMQYGMLCRGAICYMICHVVGGLLYDVIRCGIGMLHDRPYCGVICHMRCCLEGLIYNITYHMGN